MNSYTHWTCSPVVDLKDSASIRRIIADSDTTRRDVVDASTREHHALA